MKILKRNGTREEFDAKKIERACLGAIREVGIDGTEDVKTISRNIKESLEGIDVVGIERIQDMVEAELFRMYPDTDIARRYIVFRDMRTRERDYNMKKIPNGRLSREFLDRYKRVKSPMTQLGAMVYYRTYSRYIKELGRRERWEETVRRAVEYNVSLDPNISTEEVEQLYDNSIHLRQMLAGRTYWAGGTEASIKYPMSNFNCAFRMIDGYKAFEEIFYLLMVGSGVGVRVLKSDIKKLEPIRRDIELENKPYNYNNSRLEDTEFGTMTDDNAKEGVAFITVGDSKEGWVQSLKYFLDVHHKEEYRQINKIIINYDYVRPKGTELKTFGGTASGPESLIKMYDKMSRIFKSKGGKSKQRHLLPIDCLDMANLIGENVVVGGVRRTAEVILISPDDEESVNAKNPEEMGRMVDGEWETYEMKTQRYNSNNTMVYESKPPREEFRRNININRYSGEPGFLNMEAARRRRTDVEGFNPCMEILLASMGLCNLTTINVMAFAESIMKGDFQPILDAQRMSARAGLRMTLLDLELEGWDKIQKRDRLIGCSLTGWRDMVDAVGMNREGERLLLRQLKNMARTSADEYADELGIPRPILTTTVKPEGTLSLLPTVSSGVHYSHSPYYIRRVRISEDDALLKVLEELNYPIKTPKDNPTLRVVEFPVKSTTKVSGKQVSAIQQLENYAMFMKEYVEHNCSITVTVKDHEWDDVEEWMWNNWDDIVAIALMPDSDVIYDLQPLEEITEEEYKQRLTEVKDISFVDIMKYEDGSMEMLDIQECANGICPIR